MKHFISLVVLLVVSFTLYCANAFADDAAKPAPGTTVTTTDTKADSTAGTATDGGWWGMPPHDLDDPGYGGIFYEFFVDGIYSLMVVLGMSCAMHWIKMVCPFYVTCSVICEISVLIMIIMKISDFWFYYQTPEGCISTLFVWCCFCAGCGKAIYAFLVRPALP